MKYDKAWLSKLRFAVSDPSYIGPSKEECARRAGLDYVPNSASEINRLMED